MTIRVGCGEETGRASGRRDCPQSSPAWEPHPAGMRPAKHAMPRDGHKGAPEPQPCRSVTAGTARIRRPHGGPAVRPGPQRPNDERLRIIPEGDAVRKATPIHNYANVRRLEKRGQAEKVSAKERGPETEG
uniref:Uncharacterized protein n=1 Tax=Molossus molossus TaxID=27622 RepID=A0A7J8JXI7_MOLMO|nr:hypothetical protein HJG59_008135 [Molossus molossus]